MTDDTTAQTTEARKDTTMDERDDTPTSGLEVWTFARDEDVLQFAGDQDDIGQLESRTILDLFYASALDYDTPYTTEDRALVDFYDELVKAPTT